MTTKATQQQCWHLCPKCLKEWYHETDEHAAVDPWERLCSGCRVVAIGPVVECPEPEGAV